MILDSLSQPAQQTTGLPTFQPRRTMTKTWSSRKLELKKVHRLLGRTQGSLPLRSGKWRHDVIEITIPRKTNFSVKQP